MTLAWPPSATCSTPAGLLTLLCVDAEPRAMRSRDLVGRNGRVEQLSLLDPPRPNGSAAVWSTLDDKQRAQVVAALVRLIVQVAIGARAEQEHKHE